VRGGAALAGGGASPLTRERRALLKSARLDPGPKTCSMQGFRFAHPRQAEPEALGPSPCHSLHARLTGICAWDVR